MPPKLPSFQEWNVWITDLDERWNLKSEILAVLSPFTLILRRWRPQDPACHLQRWGRRKGCKGTELVKGTACLTSPVVASFVLKNPCVSSFLTQVCHGSPFSLKFFVVSLFGGLCRSDFCHDNQPLQVEERWAQGLVQHEREFKRSTLGRCCSRKKKVADFGALIWPVCCWIFGRFLERWSPLRFVHWQALYNSLLRHLKGTHPPTFPSKPARGIFRCIYRIFIYHISTQTEIHHKYWLCWVVIGCWPVDLCMFVAHNVTWDTE